MVFGWYNGYLPKKVNDDEKKTLCPYLALPRLDIDVD
jgi:hypothetical protein